MIKLGLDLHGVVDASPEFFSTLAKQMLDAGHEVYIITGREDTPELEAELIKAGMIDLTYENPHQPKVAHRHYTGILSITTYQKQLGTPVCYLNEDPTQPMMDPEIWNRSKAILCASANIDVMIDDSGLYAEYFKNIKTQYIIYTGGVMEFLNFLFYKGGIDLASG